MEYNLSMTFLTELGLKTTLNVSGVKPDLTKEQVNAHYETLPNVEVLKHGRKR